MRADLAARVPSETRWLYQAAMLVFIVTVVIGILNGLKVITFDRAQLLTHVHAGTLGWITLGVFGTCVWLFADTARPGVAPLAAGRTVLRAVLWLAAVSVPVYVAAFWSGSLGARAAFGWPVLLAILGVLAWVVREIRRSGLTLPRLAVALAVTTLALGSTLGVVIQVQLATGTKLLPDAAIGGHVAAQVVGYLVLFAMAITEWRLAPATARMPKLGVAQVVLPFVGGLIGTVGATFGSNEALGAVILFELLGVAIYVYRFAPAVLRARWTAAAPERHFAIMVPFLVADLVLLIALLYGVVSGAYADFTLIPVWLIFAFDHAMFIGVMSNGLFGLVQAAAAARRDLLAWVDHALFLGMNLGMVGFVASLLANQRDLERFFTPIMGGSILLAIAVYTARLQLGSRPKVAIAAAD